MDDAFEITAADLIAPAPGSRDAAADQTRDRVYELRRANGGGLWERLKAKAHAPQDRSHLDDPGLVDRIMARGQASFDEFMETYVSDDGEPVPMVKSEPVKAKRGPSIFRERDITRAIAGHMKAGLSVAGTKIDKAGNIVILTGKPEPVELAPDQQPAEAVNEWDTL